MEPDFWHDRWANNCIGFHEQEPNRLLRRYLGTLALRRGDRIFLPLCGKTLDIGWLLSRGFQVTGVELSQIAIEQLFQQLKLEPEISQHGELSLYRHKELEIFVGDFFQLTEETLGKVDAVYDRAALVALPKVMRRKYTRHLAKITNHSPQLLLSLVYDQTLMAGPPFSVDDAEIRQTYQNRYHLQHLCREPVPGGLKGLKEIDENVWLLRPGV